MNTLLFEHFWHDLKRHVKERWAEIAIFCIFLIAIAYLFLSSSAY